jgi:hypothetical protein
VDGAAVSAVKGTKRISPTCLGPRNANGRGDDSSDIIEVFTFYPKFLTPEPHFAIKPSKTVYVEVRRTVAGYYTRDAGLPGGSGHESKPGAAQNDRTGFDAGFEEYHREGKNGMGSVIARDDYGRKNGRLAYVMGCLCDSVLDVKRVPSENALLDHLT